MSLNDPLQLGIQRLGHRHQPARTLLTSRHPGYDLLGLLAQVAQVGEHL